MIDFSRIEAVIFDVDGTLYDQHRLRRKILREMLRTYWSAPATGVNTLRTILAYRQAHEALRHEAFSAEKQLARAALARGIEASQARSVIEEWMERRALGSLPECVYPGVVPFLVELKKRGIVCAVLSDYPAKNKLRAMGIEGFFAAVVSAEDVGRLKPDPRGLLTVIAQSGAAAGASLYIGDRQIDREAATSAGVETYIVTKRTAYFELCRALSLQGKMPAVGV